MLPWGAAVASQDLLRRGRAQCRACYEEQVALGQPVYEPLLWSLKVVSVCPRHRRPLQPLCFRRECRTAQTWTEGAIVRCRCCRASLSVPVNERHGESVMATLDWRLWVAAQMGTLIASAATQRLVPGQETIADRVRDWTAMAGTLRAVARRAHIVEGTLRDWRAGQAQPSLEHLLRLCASLGTTPLDVLAATATPPLVAQPTESATAVQPPPAYSRPGRPLPATQIQATLRAAAVEEPPPSMRAVARRLGYPQQHLQTRFPELCHAVGARFLSHLRAAQARRKREIVAETRQATRLLHAQGLYPSAKRVAALMPHPCNPGHHCMNATRVALLLELGWERRNWNKWYRRQEHPHPHLAGEGVNRN
jgi:hypothetical protein